MTTPDEARHALNIIDHYTSIIQSVGIQTADGRTESKGLMRHEHLGLLQAVAALRSFVSEHPELHLVDEVAPPRAARRAAAKVKPK